MANICRQAEAAIWYGKLFTDLVGRSSVPLDKFHTIAIAAVQASAKCAAAAIVITVTLGHSHYSLSRYRPRCPIIAVTRSAQVARHSRLYRGVFPVIYDLEREPDWLKDVENRLNYGIEFGKAKGFIKTGDNIIAVTGWKQRAKFVSTLRIVVVE